MKHLNLDSLITFTGPLDDEELHEFIEIYQSHFINKLDTLTASLSNIHPKEVRDIVHALKSSGRIIGATVFSELCEQLEHSIDKDLSAQVPENKIKEIIELGRSVILELNYHVTK